MPEAPALRVLVTGLSGLIGGVLRRALAPRHRLSALNRRPVEGLPGHRADIADLEAIQPAFEGIDVVVHLAALAGGGAPWDAVHRHNVVGTRNVLEAAHRAGVRRVVFASSGATVSAVERDPPYAALVAGRYHEVESWEWLTHRSPPRPAGLYGVSKLFGEALGRHYADAHGLSVVCLRIGAVNAADRPQAAREFSVWLSQRDAARAFELAIVAPASLRHEVVFVTSENRWGYRDLAHARHVLGYVPRDRAEAHR
jgi:nucleoside-diphosphate-sugar epimerase